MTAPQRQAITRIGSWLGSRSYLDVGPLQAAYLPFELPMAPRLLCHAVPVTEVSAGAENCRDVPQRKHPMMIQAKAIMEITHSLDEGAATGPFLRGPG